VKRNIFADKASLVLRRMLREPGRRWVLRDFVGELGISLGLAQAVLEVVESRGCGERIKRGALSYTILTNPDLLLSDWVKAYSFDRNIMKTFYFSGSDVLKRIKAALNGLPYGLTLHTGANLLTSWVQTDQVYIYLNPERWTEILINIRQLLGLKELVRGGNIHIVRPFYNNSVFYNVREIRGIRVVSNLQLYLDLFGFQPRGFEHAERLKEIVKERGELLA
jgi:hypothetical protein